MLPRAARVTPMCRAATRSTASASSPAYSRCGVSRTRASHRADQAVGRAVAGIDEREVGRKIVQQHHHRGLPLRLPLAEEELDRSARRSTRTFATER